MYVADTVLAQAAVAGDAGGPFAGLGVGFHGVHRSAGRLYSTLCEFQTQELMPEGSDASAIIGIVGTAGGFQLEARLNRAPLPEEHMVG